MDNNKEGDIWMYSANFLQMDVGLIDCLWGSETGHCLEIESLK